MLINTILELLKEKYRFTCEKEFPRDKDVVSFRLYVNGTQMEASILYLIEDTEPDTADKDIYFLRYEKFDRKESEGEPNETTQNHEADDQENIIIVRDNREIGQLINTLQDIFEKNAQISRYFQPMYRLAHRGLDIHSFLGKLHEMIGNDLMIISSSFEIVGSTFANDTHQDFTAERNGRTYLSPKSIQYIKRDANFREMTLGRISFYADDAFFRYPAIISGILTENQFVGYLGILQSARAFTEDDFALASYIAELAGQMIYTIPLQNNLFAYNASDDYFLNHLLNRDSQNIKKLASLFGWQKHLNHKRYQLLICSCPVEEKKQAQFHFYHQLQQMMPGFPIMRASNTCIILLYGETRGLLTAFSRQILTDLLTLQKQHAVLSVEYTDIGQTAFYYKYTLRLLENLLTSPAMTIRTMESLYLMFLQEAYTEGEPASALVHPDFRELEAYDRNCGSELAVTLSAYLKSNRNITEMAKSLHISKSAGFYRINQIRDILADPFSDRQRMVCYECSEMLMEMQ